jgi:DNA-binding MarR family transcriptional regulator
MGDFLREGGPDNDLKCAEILIRLGPMSAGELGEKAGLTTGAITGIVDRLEKAGWAKRVADPNDRRRVSIHPGPQDTATVAGLYDSYMRSLTALLEHYSDPELALISEFIERLIKINYERAGQKRPLFTDRQIELAPIRQGDGDRIKLHYLITRVVTEEVEALMNRTSLYRKSGRLRA